MPRSLEKLDTKLVFKSTIQVSNINQTEKPFSRNSWKIISIDVIGYAKSGYDKKAGHIKIISISKKKLSRQTKGMTNF